METWLIDVGIDIDRSVSIFEKQTAASDSGWETDVERGATCQYLTISDKIENHRWHNFQLPHVGAFESQIVR